MKFNKKFFFKLKYPDIVGVKAGVLVFDLDQNTGVPVCTKTKLEDLQGLALGWEGLKK